MPSNPSCAPPTALRSGGRRPISTDQPPQAPERLPQATEPIGQTYAPRHCSASGSWPTSRASPPQLPPPNSVQAAPSRQSREALAARFRPCRRGSRSCPSFCPSGAPAGYDLAHAVDHRLLVHRDPSSRQGPPCRKPGKTNSKLAEIFDRASSFSALVGIAVDVVSLFMALLSFVESSPRA